MSALVLSLFPGIGLLDMAFEAEGFCVVRGPDLLWGGDIKSFHPPAGKFDGVIGGPPCKRWTRLAHLIKANGYELAPDLIPEFERAVEEVAPEWWIMENVEGAPIPKAATGWWTLRDVDCGGLTSRVRRFAWAGLELIGLPEPTTRPAPFQAVTCDARSVPVAVAVGGNGKIKRTRQTGGTAPHEGPRMSLEEMLRRQGFPESLLDESSLSLTGKREAIGNGVPLAMGRAIARAVKAAIACP